MDKKYTRDNLGAGDFYRIPDYVAHKYHGAGHGWIVVDKEIDQVIDMGYNGVMFETMADINAGFRIFRAEDNDAQNVTMSDDVGWVIGENDAAVIYAVNFSTYTACLF